MTTEQDRTRLRELAQAATPGPWEWNDDNYKLNSTRLGIVAFAEPIGYSNSRILISEEDANYVAAANPQAVIALLDEIERLHEDLTITQKALQTERLDHISTLGQAGELEQQLAAVTAARDELADMLDAMDWTKPDGLAAHESRISALRKAGSQ